MTSIYNYIIELEEYHESETLGALSLAKKHFKTVNNSYFNKSRKSKHISKVQKLIARAERYEGREMMVVRKDQWKRYYSLQEITL
jgi:hypothetical protein